MKLDFLCKTQNKMGFINKHENFGSFLLWAFVLVLSRLVPCRKGTILARLVLHAHFGLVYYLTYCKNDDEKTLLLRVIWL